MKENEQLTFLTSISFIGWISKIGTRPRFKCSVWHSLPRILIKQLPFDPLWSTGSAGRRRKPMRMVCYYLLSRGIKFSNSVMPSATNGYGDQRVELGDCVGFTKTMWWQGCCVDSNAAELALLCQSHIIPDRSKQSVSALISRIRAAHSLETVIVVAIVIATHDDCMQSPYNTIFSADGSLLSSMTGCYGWHPRSEETMSDRWTESWTKTDIVGSSSIQKWRWLFAWLLLLLLLFFVFCFLFSDSLVKVDGRWLSFEPDGANHDNDGIRWTTQCLAAMLVDLKWMTMRIHDDDDGMMMSVSEEGIVCKAMQRCKDIKGGG